ncbi:MAG: AAA-type ATPase lid domain-containing protein, partial [Planctomycetota bacterium]
QDLLYRLNTVEIRVPPLRDRKEDIPLLATHFLHRHVARYRKQITGFDSASMQALLNHSWPGNVRELDHTVERAVLMARGRVVQESDFAQGQKYEDSPRFEEMTLEEMERWLITKTIARFSGDISQTAEALGLSRKYQI